MKSLSIRMAMVVSFITILNFSCSTASSLMGVLGSNPNLSGITSLLKGAGGISNILGSSGPATLLAPTNDALAKAGGTDMIQNLLKPENKSQLVDLLKKQVVPGNVSADALKAGGVKDAAGNPINLGSAMLGQGTKTKDGGMVYTIDQLLK
ncbi:MAG TPA: fasciclin domain-containing protein [Puia sp.]|nr:fasciclin domain-containing protein [Puia sp.]